MGRSHTADAARAPARRASRDRSRAAAPGSLGLELAGVGLCLGGVVLMGALLTLAPAGAPGGTENIAGSLGQTLASALVRAFGLGSWVVPAFLLAWGVSCVRGRRPRAFGRRALLLPILVALLAITAALLLRSSSLPGIERSGPGGYFGVALGSALYGALGPLSGLAALVGVLALLRLMTDLDPAPLVRRVRSWLSFEGAEAATAAPPRRRGAPPEDETGEEAPDGGEEGEDEDWEWEYEDEEDAEAEDGEWDDEEEGEEEDEEDPAEAARRAAAARVQAERAAAAQQALAAKRRRKRMQNRGEYVAPPLELLTPGEQASVEAVQHEVEGNIEVLEDALASFGVEARVVASQRGPVITFFEIKVPSGVRLNRITALADDLAIALKAPSIRIVAPIPGKSTVGIEVPNLQRDSVGMRDLLEESRGLDKKAVPIVLGRDTAGRPIIEDLASMPHMLIAGATGSGKSVCINSILVSVLYTRSFDETQLILIDPKQVELSFYEGIPHLLTPVVTDMKKAAKILEWAVENMEERYAKLLAAGVRNITGYNSLSAARREAARERHGLSEEELPDKLPYLVIVVDELADLMLTNGKDVELAITRLAQKSRAVGIHIILATQRPSTNVITGLIKANMPTRVSFVVSSKIDSRVVLDANGADKLLGMGDMLYMHPRSLHLRRAQGTFVSDQEARDIVEHLKEKYPEPEYEDLLRPKSEGMGDPMEEDDLYNDAVRAVLSSRLGSASMLQRRLGIGYTRASRLVDMMCDRQVVGPHVGSKAREVYLTLEEWEAMQAEAEKAPPPPSEAFDPDDPPCVDESWD